VIAGASLHPVGTTQASPASTSPLDNAAHLGAALDEAAAELLRSTGYTQGRPSVERMLETLQAVVRPRGKGELGTLAIEADTYVISTRRTDPAVRQRFTIAHEIGHILLFELVGDSPETIRRLARDHSDRHVEQLCDRVAAELLMPKRAFRDALLAKPLTLDTLLELGDAYQTSFDTTLIRVTEVCTDMQMALFAVNPLTSGRSQAFELVRVFGQRGGTSLLPRTLSSRELRPDIFSQAAQAQRATTTSLTITSGGYAPLSRRAIAIRVKTQPPHRTSPTAADIASRRIPTRDADYLLLLQGRSAPLQEWRSLAGRDPRRTARQTPEK
jgi:hypothetical protein